MEPKEIHQSIDLVYTWVDGDDPDYRKLVNQYSEKPLDLNPERTRDIYQLMKYSLRSVEKFAPWINHIYILTCRPQKPDWLDINHPKISIIHHDEVFDPEDVPTFNYNVIESYIHKIPELSDDFIYLNDDFLFGNDVYPEDFYTKDGKVLIHGTLFGENLGWRIYNKKNDIVGLGLIEHSPLLIRKEWWQSMQDARPELIEDIKSHKFREGTDVMTYKLYRWYALKYQSQHCSAIKLPDLLKIHAFHKITNNYKKQKRAFDWLEKKRPKFYCLNDDQGSNLNPDVVKLTQEFLRKGYPQKSGFEI
ncbi:Stealth protein CR4, conserved region 4 [Ekhidna lutea]|uniref:Capsular polysaccharide phosphotransferase SacB n=1 Tax=Ekhidna lutea TaxID=447679 RepID=A0A239FSW7_EKHLU|nr:Stealth CR1 domain-containing protein [Ekhidna lutea]SNS59668.1 Stealth protein CR4, conserved region 4 [Ekhidna lutea]